MTLSSSSQLCIVSLLPPLPPLPSLPFAVWLPLQHCIALHHCIALLHCIIAPLLFSSSSSFFFLLLPLSLLLTSSGIDICICCTTGTAQQQQHCCCHCIAATGCIAAAASIAPLHCIAAFAFRPRQVIRGPVVVHPDHLCLSRGVTSYPDPPRPPATRTWISPSPTPLDSFLASGPPGPTSPGAYPGSFVNQTGPRGPGLVAFAPRPRL